MADLRTRIYTGEILTFSPTHTSIRLVEQAWEVLLAGLGPSPRYCRLQGKEFFHALAPLRQQLASALTRPLLAELGEDPDAYAVDTLRLRGVLSGGHLVPEAAPAYSVHRDTWYANPRAQLNFWIPLHSVTDQDGLSILPEYFGVPIDNTSAQFDYARWQGFQQLRTAAEFPVATTPPPLPPAIPMQAAEILVFSAAHLHGTHPHMRQTIRYSLDFRAVHRQDSLSGGAPDPDNHSTGSTLVDYRQ